MIIFRLIGPGPDCVLASCVFAFCDQPTTTADPHLWRRAIQPTKLGTGRSPRSQGLSSTHDVSRGEVVRSRAAAAAARAARGRREPGRARQDTGAGAGAA
eukprot:scaffold93890_cov63-Phaeocystis_antarctica.AAC.1